MRAQELLRHGGPPGCLAHRRGAIPCGQAKHVLAPRIVHGMQTLGHIARLKGNVSEISTSVGQGQQRAS